MILHFKNICIFQKILPNHFKPTFIWLYIFTIECGFKEAAPAAGAAAPAAGKTDAAPPAAASGGAAPAPPAAAAGTACFIIPYHLQTFINKETGRKLWNGCDARYDLNHQQTNLCKYIRAYLL